MTRDRLARFFRDLAFANSNIEKLAASNALAEAFTSGEPERDRRGSDNPLNGDENGRPCPNCDSSTIERDRSWSCSVCPWESPDG